MRKATEATSVSKMVSLEHLCWVIALKECDWWVADKSFRREYTSSAANTGQHPHNELMMLIAWRNTSGLEGYSSTRFLGIVRLEMSVNSP